MPSSRPALNQEQLIDRFEDQLRRHLGDRALERLALGRDVRELRPGTKDGNLTLLELALGQDVAVHLDQDLLDDLRPQGNREKSQQDTTDGQHTLQHGNSLEVNILRQCSQ